MSLFYPKYFLQTVCDFNNLLMYLKQPVHAAGKLQVHCRQSLYPTYMHPRYKCFKYVNMDVYYEFLIPIKAMAGARIIQSPCACCRYAAGTLQAHCKYAVGQVCTIRKCVLSLSIPNFSIHKRNGKCLNFSSKFSLHLMASIVFFLLFNSI